MSPKKTGLHILTYMIDKVKRVSNFSIRFKIIVPQIVLIALVSAFIYTYYPNQQKQAAIEAIQSKIKSISNMFSIGVGIGMGDTDFVAVSEALNWANADSSVVYISVVDNENKKIISFKKDGLTLPLQRGEYRYDSIWEEDKIIYYKTNILYQQTSFGTLTIGYSLKNLESSIASLKRTTLYFCLGFFLVGVVASIITGSLITSDITALDRTVKAISAGAEKLRVRIMSKDEIGQLGEAFNRMLDTLEKSKNELVDYSKKLQKQNKELDQFSYVVSHDLKAPLRAIYKLSEWIEEDIGENVSEEARNNMALLRGRIARLEALINGLLEYSKIGRLHIKPEKTDVEAMLKDIIDLLNPPPHFTITISEGMPVFNTKKILLQQIFINLISNAIKYNDKLDARIKIRVEDADMYYRFSVEDNGMGIDAAFHEKVFVIFQTLNARDKVESTGVGLSIIKKSIEDVGGSISLMSEVGKGSTFTFLWPKEKLNRTVTKEEGSENNLISYAKAS